MPSDETKTNESAVVEFVAPSSVVDALGAAIARAKQGDPMRHVYVVTPSGVSSGSLMNALARSQGVFNVSFVTLDHLAREITIDDGNLPALRGALRRELVRRVATSAQLPLSKYDAAVLAKGLNPVFEDLRRRAPEEVDRIAENGELNAEIVRLFREFRLQIERRYSDTQDALLRAEIHVRSVGFASPVVALVQEPLDAASLKLFEALSDAKRLTIVATKCGIELLDQALETALWGLTHVSVDERVPFTVNAICVAPDADAEVQVAIQELMRLAEAGVPFSEMAILYASASPYAQIVEDQLHLAGIPCRGRTAFQLSHSLTGGFVVRLFDVLETGFSFEAVSAWLLSIPALEAGQWLRVARAARVTGDAATWLRRLRAYAGRPPSSQVSEIDIQSASEFAAFIQQFIAWSETSASSWREWIAWTQDAIEHYLGSHSARKDWPPSEASSAVRVEEVLGTLAILDDLGGDVGRERFIAALRDELTEQTAKGTTRRSGVFTGTIGDAIGCVFEANVVCGMAEALYPGSNQAKGLLAAITVPGEESQSERDQRLFALRVASSGTQILTVPAADVRSQRAMRPSRLVTDIASSMTGRPVSGEELLHPHEEWPWLRVSRSFAELIRHSGLQASSQVDQLSILDAYVQNGIDCVDTDATRNNEALQLGIAMIRARDGNAMSRFDGMVGEAVSFGGEESAAIAPTTLERWATCPFRHLLQDILSVEPDEDEPALLTVNKRDRGLLIHNILESFINTAPPRTSPSHKWSDEDRLLLHKIVDSEFDAAALSGVAPEGFAATVERKMIHQHMDVLLDKDEVMREQLGLVPVAVERRFGAGAESVAVALSNEQPVWLKGRVDRIDASSDRSRFLVTDYKTGRSDSMPQLKDDPVGAGKSLQLAVYAHAISKLYPDATSVKAENWYVLDSSKYYERKGIDFDEDAKDRLNEVFDLIAGSFTAGAFPAVSGEDDGRASFKNCRTCPYDGLCPSDRAEAWERKSDDLSVGSYVTLGKSGERTS